MPNRNIVNQLNNTPAVAKFFKQNRFENNQSNS